MEQHFRPTITDPGFDVVTENRYFVAPDGVEWEELSFSVNGTKWGADRPPFPLLQAGEGAVAAAGAALRRRLPLPAGRHRARRRLRLLRRPLRAGATRTQSLYRGTVWIDRRTFARVKLQAVQTQLSAPVVSNEEIQRYAPVTSIGGRPVFLFDAADRRGRSC